MPLVIGMEIWGTEFQLPPPTESEPSLLSSHIHLPGVNFCKPQANHFEVGWCDHWLPGPGSRSECTLAYQSDGIMFHPGSYWAWEQDGTASTPKGTL